MPLFTNHATMNIDARSTDNIAGILPRPVFFSLAGDVAGNDAKPETRSETPDVSGRQGVRRWSNQWEEGEGEQRGEARATQRRYTRIRLEKKKQYKTLAAIAPTQPVTPRHSRVARKDRPASALEPASPPATQIPPSTPTRTATSPPAKGGSSPTAPVTPAPNGKPPRPHARTPARPHARTPRPPLAHTLSSNSNSNSAAGTTRTPVTTPGSDANGPLNRKSVDLPGLNTFAPPPPPPPPSSRSSRGGDMDSQGPPPPYEEPPAYEPLASPEYNEEHGAADENETNAGMGNTTASPKSRRRSQRRPAFSFTFVKHGRVQKSGGEGACVVENRMENAYQRISFLFSTM
ncbi:hypothetical protein B0H14DRAFT_3535740 [Mycena olivaceomarginata]|nr:hypothetical protein B0H14DRAFT_3535740 [Mycena olivaceomarginata]